MFTKTRNLTAEEKQARRDDHANGKKLPEGKPLLKNNKVIEAHIKVKHPGEPAVYWFSDEDDNEFMEDQDGNPVGPDRFIHPKHRG